MPIPLRENSLPMRALLAGARRRHDDLLSLTRQLVLAESPSDDRAAVNHCVEQVMERVRTLGGRAKLHRQRHHGDLLEARFGPKARAGEKPLLLLGHLDTVWPVGTLQSMPCRMADGRLYGPGTADMKAGVAMALGAVELLAESGALEREVRLLLVSDEEIGSPVSRPVTEKLALESRAVFVLEAALGQAYKTARKGTGNFRIDVKGVAAHAGADFARGASALLELARQIETVSGFTDLERGLTVCVGRAQGGSKSNVVPAEAWAEVDVRIARKADGPRMERRMGRLKAADRRCTVTVTGGIDRPPMERKRGTVRLYQQARALAAEMGLDLPEASTGGASDGNLTAALGVPTLDGMGPVGEGAHAPHESIVVAELPIRTALLAGMILAC